MKIQTLALAALAAAAIAQDPAPATAGGGITITVGNGRHGGVHHGGRFTRHHRRPYIARHHERRRHGYRYRSFLHYRYSVPPRVTIYHYAPDYPAPQIIERVVPVPVPAPGPTVIEKTEPYCREFTREVIIGGKPAQQAYGQACRQPDGSWRIVSEDPIPRP